MGGRGERRGNRLEKVLANIEHLPHAKKPRGHQAGTLKQTEVLTAAL